LDEERKRWRMKRRKGGGLDETCEEKRRKKTGLTLLFLHKIAKKCTGRTTHSNIITMFCAKMKRKKCFY